METNIIRIFDTTLRDGEQSPGASMNTEEKLRVAEQLVRLNVDIIEAGFPAASPGDLEAVRAIARSTRGTGVAIAGFARATTGDIDAAWQAVCEADQPMIHVVLATSDLHLSAKLGMSRQDALERAAKTVAHARNLCPIVEFAAEDATRSDRDYLCRVFEAVIGAGASIINVPDTVGYTTPNDYAKLIHYIREHVRGAEEVLMSAHCHDDLGMGTANTLVAITAGVRQVDVTINGLGERAGNTALEEVVMALRTRPDAFGNADTRINAQELVAASQLVSQLTGIPVQPNKAIVGANAFAHEAGIHQDGMLKNRLTYEIMTPQSVGWQETKLVLGKHSGRHGLDARLRQLGYKLTAEQLQVAYRRFVALADQQKAITDADLLSIVQAGEETPAAV